MLNVCKGAVNANIYAKETKDIKDDKLQILGISFSIPSGVATIGGGGVTCAPKYSGTTVLCGLKAR